MNNGRQRAMPRWDTPSKKEDWNEKKERPDAGMILKRSKKIKYIEILENKGGSHYKPPPFPSFLTENTVKNH